MLPQEDAARWTKTAFGNWQIEVAHFWHQQHFLAG
jgi:hypothetical protein